MNRADKVGHEIKKVISQVVGVELQDPRLGFTTITKVECTNDLRFARIFFSVYGDAGQWKQTQEGLEHAKGFIRHALGERLGLRFVPEIAFESDHSSEYSIMVENQLQEISSYNELMKKKRKRPAHGATKTDRSAKKKRT